MADTEKKLQELLEKEVKGDEQRRLTINYRKTEGCQQEKHAPDESYELQLEKSN